jgi:Na+-driven multidrug efflux pump
VAGAAWATVASQMLSVVLCLAYSLKRFPILHLRRRDWRMDWGFAKQHLSTGLAMGMQMAIIAVSVMFLQAAINRFGTDTVKAFSAAMKIDQLAVQPMFSIGVAIATFTAQNYGAKKMARIREGARRGTLICLGMGILGCLLMVFSGGWFLGLFGIGANEPGVVREARLYLNTVSVFYFLLGFLFVFRNVLQGMGKNSMPIASSTVETVVRFFFASAFAEWWGVIGVCFINPLCWLLSVVLLVSGYLMAMRNVRFDEAPGYETVVANYAGQTAPSASVRIKLDENGTDGTRSSVRIL